MTNEPHDDVIELTFPASSSYVRLSRLAAAALAAELGFDVEAVDDLRIAVDEAVTLLVQGAPTATVSLQFRPTIDGLEVSGRCEGDGLPPIEVTDLVEAILSATADEHRVSSGTGFRAFELRKTRADLSDALDDELDDPASLAEAWQASNSVDGSSVDGSSVE